MISPPRSTGAWGEPARDPPRYEEANVSIVARGIRNLQVEIVAGRHRLVADEPPGIGDDTGPNPYDLLLASLGACTAMTVQMYAKSKNWPLTGVEVRLDHCKIHAQDCEDCESEPTARVDIIERELRFEGDLTREQVDRLALIANRCPVHRTLTGEIKIRTRVDRP
jgi:putative redox protein